MGFNSAFQRLNTTGIFRGTLQSLPDNPRHSLWTPCTVHLLSSTSPSMECLVRLSVKLHNYSCHKFSLQSNHQLIYAGSNILKNDINLNWYLKPLFISQFWIIHKILYSTSQKTHCLHFARTRRFIFLEKNGQKCINTRCSLAGNRAQIPLSFNLYCTLTLILLTWRIGWAHNNARK